MPWIKLDDQWMDHPKIIQAGRDGRDMWLASITYCAKHLTDGFFSENLLPNLAVAAGVDVANCWQIASLLVDVCLWERTDNGFHIHDYTDYNPTKEQAEATKKARSEAGRAGGEAKASKMASKMLAKDKQKSAPSPSPIPIKENDIGADAPLPVEENSEDLSITATPGGRILHALLERENKAKSPPRRTAKKFPSVACKAKWLAQCEARLNGQLSSAITRAFEKGIFGISEIVDFVAKYDGVVKTPAGNRGSKFVPSEVY